MNEYPFLPEFFDLNKDTATRDEFLLVADSLALKGQVWPGMGKMDLANDEMRRTRNQRKPKSVIDRMQKASERISPTQVVMTPEFKVERVKDVYDDTSSPAPGQEESTPPRKAPKAKRKKPTPLAEVSANIPKQRRSTARGSKSTVGKKATTKKEPSRQEEPVTFPSPVQLKHTQDVFRDDASLPDPIGEFPFPPTRDGRRFNLRNRHAPRNMDNFFHSNLVSPTPHPRDLAPRQLPTRGGPGSLRPESFPPGMP
ncbi:hypothetical protein ACHAPJ_006883 [Fusarium lateritium]